MTNVTNLFLIAFLKTHRAWNLIYLFLLFFVIPHWKKEWGLWGGWDGAKKITELLPHLASVAIHFKETIHALLCKVEKGPCLLATDFSRALFLMYFQWAEPSRHSAISALDKRPENYKVHREVRGEHLWSPVKNLCSCASGGYIMAEIRTSEIACSGN